MVIFVQGNYTLDLTDPTFILNTRIIYLQCRTNLGVVNITLPRISTSGQTWGFKVFVYDAGNNASVNNITVTPNAADKINGSGAATVINSNGANAVYEIIGTDAWALSTSQVSVATDDWKLNGNNNGAEKYIGTNDAFSFPIRVNNIEIGRFTPTGINLFDGAIIQGLISGKCQITFDTSTPSLDMFVDETGSTDDDFMGAGFNIKSSTYGGTRLNVGLTSEASLGIIPPAIGFRVTQSRIRSYGIPTYANDTAAGVGGLAEGDLWKEADGAGGFNLKVKS